MLRMRSAPFAFTFVIRFVAQVDKGAIESPQEKLPLQMKGQQYEDYLLQHHCYSGDSPSGRHGDGASSVVGTSKSIITDDLKYWASLATRQFWTKRPGLFVSEVDQESILRSVNISNWLSANSHRKYATASERQG